MAEMSSAPTCRDDDDLGLVKAYERSEDRVIQPFLLCNQHRLVLDETFGRAGPAPSMSRPSGITRRLKK